MKYRKFGSTGLEVSALGFGCMRLPIHEDKTIDEEKAIAMIRHAIDSGVNYVDTAYPYHQGTSELVVGKALKDGYREKTYLADKLPVWLIEKEEDFDKYLDEQLEKLGTDHIDFYLLHALSRERFEERVKKFNLTKKMEEAKAAGKIRYLGFSFHDSLDVFKEIVDYYHWDFCQIQYNYLDRNEQAGDKGYALAESLGVPLVIMEPVKGGNLAGFSEDINGRFRRMDPEASVASWALRWVGSHPNVKVILSGMSTMQQVEDNLKTFAEFQPLSEAESAELDDIVKELRSRVQNGCTGCRYCMPCPAGVNIPGNFKVWNNYHMYRTYGHVQRAWETDLKDEEKAKNCVKCGKCETLCPQKLSIRADLARVQQELDDRIFQ